VLARTRREAAGSACEDKNTSRSSAFVSATSDVDVAVVLVDVYYAQLDEIVNATAQLLNKIPADA
jgi:hypothetical protein